MGFSSVSINGLDMANDAYYNMKDVYPDGAIASLEEEFLEDVSQYNTPGPVNVALCIVDGELKLAHLDGFKPLVEKTLEFLDETVRRMIADNYEEFLADHQRLAEGLRAFI